MPEPTSTARKIVPPGDLGRRITDGEPGSTPSASGATPASTKTGDLPEPSRGSWLGALPGIGTLFITGMVGLGLHDYYKEKPDTRPFGSNLMDSPARVAVDKSSWQGVQQALHAAKGDPKHIPDALFALNRLSEDSQQVLAFAKSIGGSAAVLERCKKALNFPAVGIGYPTLGLDIAEGQLQGNAAAGDVIVARGMKAVLDCVRHQLEEASKIAGGTSSVLPSKERLAAMGDPRIYGKIMEGISELIR